MTELLLSLIAINFAIGIAALWVAMQARHRLNAARRSLDGIGHDLAEDLNRMRRDGVMV